MTTTAAPAPAPATERPMPGTANAGALAGELRRIPLEELHESPFNPRRTFNAQQLEELGRSLRTGQLTALTVRPRKAGGYEIGAGHRRYRAAKLAQLPALLCHVREMRDPEFVELLVFENNQRDDVHELEEAEGYVTLMKTAGYDVPRIAERLGRSIKYVYDRLKLLQLTPEAKQHFRAGRIEAGHAILLARLTPVQQAKALKEGVFERSRADDDVDPDGQAIELGLEDRKHRHEKACSVRELASWINDHVRATEEGATDPVLFPQTAAAIATARQQRTKLVHITYEHQLREDVRDGKVHTYGPLSWARADGQPFKTWDGRTKVSKTCGHAVLGLVAAGPHRNEAFLVCVTKPRCPIHWPGHYKKAQAKKRAITDPKAAKKTGGAAKPAPKPATPFEDTEAGRNAIRQAIERRAPAIVAKVKQIATTELKGLSDALVWNFFRWLDGGYNYGHWSAVGKWSARSDESEYDEVVDELVLPKLAHRNRRWAATAEGARQAIAWMIYRSRDWDLAAFDREVLKEAVAIAKAAAPPPPKASTGTPAKGKKLATGKKSASRKRAKR